VLGTGGTGVDSSSMGGAGATPALTGATGGLPQTASGAGGMGPSGSGGASAGSGGSPPAVMTSAPAGYPYDTNVHFDWPSTTPMAGHCQPGSYSGNFTCDLSGGTGLFTIMGPVQFTLSPSSSGEFLTISGGTLDFDTQVGLGNFPATAGLSGQLDCEMNELHAKVENGVGSSVPFYGQMDGRLDRLTETLTGTWTLASGTDPTVPSLISCTGTWSATRQ